MKKIQEQVAKINESIAVKRPEGNPENVVRDLKIMSFNCMRNL